MVWKLHESEGKKGERKKQHDGHMSRKSRTLEN